MEARQANKKSETQTQAAAATNGHKPDHKPEAAKADPKKAEGKAEAKVEAKAKEESPDRVMKLRAVRFLADEKAFNRTATLLKSAPLKGVCLVQRGDEFLIGIKKADRTEENEKLFREFKNQLKEQGLFADTSAARKKSAKHQPADGKGAQA